MFTCLKNNNIIFLNTSNIPSLSKRNRVSLLRYEYDNSKKYNIQPINREISNEQLKN